MRQYINVILPIILKVAVRSAEKDEGQALHLSQPLRLKIDPGSKTTGLAIVNDNTGDVPFFVLNNGYTYSRQRQLPNLNIEDNR